ncbi:pyrimidine/purine nucleoside phosphorylase [uncultured Cedecea sp.]|uniref:pyrimidine/purine nucleoside phosphorylase n=1 Tax=uncultured Cedecea sp. TaxID=988762 RepID=UPI00263397BF|nr:pyrimidine/purine nucleoside phosphorylase [uncultured Cedecea sp.]
MSELFEFDSTHIFFDGKVLLRDFYQNKIKVTMGFMAAGEFKWLADKTERFIILSGCAYFILGDDVFPALPNSEITIPEGTVFTVKVSEPIDYRCYYG